MFGKRYLLLLLLFIYQDQFLHAQQAITLKEAVAMGVENYGTIRAKSNYAKASKALEAQAKRDYIPNLNIGAQQDYGTVNGQNGPLYGFGGLGVASSGLPLPEQNWNAAFGALYLANVNWDFFAFGRAKDKILTAKAAATRDSKDWQQEIFKHKIRVAAAYLNLIAAQQLVHSYEKNVDRADTFRRIIVVRALNGLVAGVDSSQANAESSNAKISLTKAKDFEQEQNSQLAQLIGQPLQDYLLDSFFISRIPDMPAEIPALQDHPVLQWYMSRIDVSKEQTRYYKTFYYPAFSLVGIYQTRGSGFGNGYASNQSDFDHDYLHGINPTRANYLFGVGVTWNLTQPFRMSQQVKAQKFISKGLQDEYTLAEQQIQAQLALSEAKIKYAMDNYREVAVQVKAASDAFTQKSVLYKNGLTNLVDLTQSLYALVRAETDRDIAYSNVWQALLLKAAAAGDFSIFENQL
jgi:outer membrane protein TolC